MVGLEGSELYNFYQNVSTVYSGSRALTEWYDLFDWTSYLIFAKKYVKR